MTEKLQRQTSAQYGDWNTMDINLGRRTESLVFMKQVGDKNKMIIQLEDRRQTEYIELKSSGKGNPFVIQIIDKIILTVVYLITCKSDLIFRIEWLKRMFINLSQQNQFY